MLSTTTKLIEKVKKIIQIENDELVECLRKGLSKYLVLNKNGILYQSSSAFTKTFKKEFNDYTPYELRKAVSSSYIAQNDIEKIKTLEHNQGHDLQTILNNYNIYSKVIKKISTIQSILKYYCIL